MPIRFHLSHQFAPAAEAADSHSFIVADRKEDFESLSIDSAVAIAAGINDEASLSLVRLAGAALKPGNDSGAATPLSIVSNGKLKTVVVARLSLAASRHNAPSRCHSLSNLLKAHKPSGDLKVVIIPSCWSHALSLCCAVARQFPVFSLKSSGVPADPTVDVIVHSPEVEAESAATLVKEATYLGESIRLTQRLVDTPPNMMQTKHYIEEAKLLAEELQCRIEIIQGNELEERGFGGLWGVGKAAEYLPALVILSHEPEGAPAESICLVGKGIVYDTGGLSIKVPPNMAGMKMDMGGSAACVGAFRAVVKCGIQRRVHALLCLAENAIGPLATRPDDVHKFMSGKTVEINNTDAEGRLVLADGCFYASHAYNPTVIIDIATLTGAQLIATGKNHGAIYCSDEALEADAVRVGRSTGDLVHPIPYCPEFYRGEFVSKVADMKNSVSDRNNAQASCAGQFIGNHIDKYLENGGRWLHVDMAGPVWSGERATGFGVALLFGLIKAEASK